MPALGDHRPPLELFWLKVEKTEGCWLWTGTKIREGYGRFRVGDRKVLAHRWSWEQANGRKAPEGMLVLHTCDNPSCVRPAHLRLGTHQDNMADMSAKGRVVSGNTKLTWEIVSELRARYGDGASQAQLARDYGVSKKQISVIVNRKQWVR